MDYEIAFDETEQSYRVVTDYEFSAIADWLSEELRQREDIQKVLQEIHLMTERSESKNIKQGVYSITISADGVQVTRQLDLSGAGEEINKIFDGQSHSYQASEDGIKAECGLDDMSTLLENWYNVLY